MREFGLWALLALPVAAVGLLAPKSEGLARALRSAAAAVMLFALLSPLSGLDPSELFPTLAPDAFLPEEGAAWREALREGFEEGVERDIADRFSMRVEASAVLDGEGRPLSVTVLLRKEDLFGDAVGISHYIEATYGAECNIEFGEE